MTNEKHHKITKKKKKKTKIKNNKNAIKRWRKCVKILQCGCSRNNEREPEKPTMRINNFIKQKKKIWKVHCNSEASDLKGFAIHSAVTGAQELLHFFVTKTQ